VVVGKEGLNLGGGAAGFSERHSYTKTESDRFGNHRAGLALTLLRRSQRRRLNCPRFNRLTRKYIPPCRVLHPYPEERFFASRH
jgi:hypothetical protein